MTYEPLGLRSTHDLSSLGLRTQTVHRTRNATSHSETQVTKARNWRGAEIVMMAPRPTLPMPTVIRSADRDNKVHADKRPRHGKGTLFYHVIVVPSQRSHRPPTLAMAYKRRRSTTRIRGWLNLDGPRRIKEDPRQKATAYVRRD
jgi:predicted membrane-bound mannosyltransferase